MPDSTRPDAARNSAVTLGVGPVADPPTEGPQRVPALRSPRNHTRRVEDLCALEAAGVLRFIESRRNDRSAWEYVVHVHGEPEPKALPTRRIDTWLAAWRSALTAFQHLTHSPGGPGQPADGTHAQRRTQHADQN